MNRNMVKVEEPELKGGQNEGTTIFDGLKQTLASYVQIGTTSMVDAMFGTGKTEEEKQEIKRREELSDKSIEQLMVELILAVDSTNRGVDEISLSVKEFENTLEILKELLTEISNRESLILDKLGNNDEDYLSYLPLLIEKLNSEIIKEEGIENKEIKEFKNLFQNSLARMEKILEAGNKSNKNEEKEQEKNKKIEELEIINKNLKSISKTVKFLFIPLIVLCVGGIIGTIFLSLKFFFKKKFLKKDLR